MTEKGTSQGAKGVRHIEVFAEASSIENWRKQVIAGQPDAGTPQDLKYARREIAEQVRTIPQA